jgi:hypothetical protein
MDFEEKIKKLKPIVGEKKTKSLWLESKRVRRDC